MSTKSKTNCSNAEGTQAMEQVDREIDGAFRQIKIGVLVMAICFAGLVATFIYGVAFS